jgi:hypothetical protein
MLILETGLDSGTSDLWPGDMLRPFQPPEDDFVLH